MEGLAQKHTLDLCLQTLVQMQPPRSHSLAPSFQISVGVFERPSCKLEVMQHPKGLIVCVRV